MAQQAAILALEQWKAALAVQQVVIPALEQWKAALAVQQVAQQQAAILAQVLQVVQLAVIPVLVIRGVRY
ncbi:hypothetical protein SNB42_01855, partial [Escherichia coli]|nr:hypothetical protein [Escherichia coli]MDZ8494332.1 hypothetical protein [Escherichia coli]